MTQTLLKTALIASTAVLLMAAGPKADLNQDGQVTKAEFTEAAKAHFIAADADSDGFLTEDERNAFREVKKTERKDKRFDKLDANGDGAISREEMDAISQKSQARKETMKAKILERYDTNLDGELNDAERTVMKAERDAKGEGKRGRKGKRGKRADRPNPDANGDGFISLDEHLAVSEQLFTRLDANADGVLTEGEGRKRKGRRGWGKRGG